MDTPPIRGIAETVLYTDDLSASRAFFNDVLGLPIIFDTDTMTVFDVGTSQTLLVFARDCCEQDREHSGGVIPGHRSDGPAHMAFHVSLADYEAWKATFARRGVPILSEVTFGTCGRSLYFNDPSGNVLELATPGHWQNF